MDIFVNKLSGKKELFALVMMLEMLHLSIWLDFGSVVSRSFMLSHLGLFLIWQPVWRGDQKLSTKNIIVFFVFTLAVTIWLNLWLLFAWLILLIGCISGRITFDRNERTIYILATAFLILELLFACVPALANIRIEFQLLYRLFLPVIPVLIFFLPKSESKHHVYMVDFINAIMASMLTSLVAFGSLLNMFLSEASYFSALAQTSISIGGFIICISWLLTSQYRFGGLGQLWSNYMLNIGTPFEEWLSELSKVNKLDLSPNEFLQKAMQKLVNFSWVSGIKWRINETTNKVGDKTPDEIEITIDRLTVFIYTYSTAGAALKLHGNLLMQLLYNFYLSKEREKELTQQAHLKAIYETGARITHDIKNLLQSLQAITSIITHDTDGSSIIISQQVLKKQMPNITQRLQLALDKLQAPESQDKKEIHLKIWWHDVQKRNAHNKLLFQTDIQGDLTVPVDLFDSVIDNLLENARSKLMNEPEIEITITIICNTNVIYLTVCDSGSKIPDHISKDLILNPIPSDNGLGIGLYQANKLAEIFGYQLKLTHNQLGRVCFELTSK